MFQVFKFNSSSFEDKTPLKTIHGRPAVASHCVCCCFPLEAAESKKQTLRRFCKRLFQMEERDLTDKSCKISLLMKHLLTFSLTFYCFLLFSTEMVKYKLDLHSLGKYRSHIGPCVHPDSRHILVLIEIEKRYGV